ncbi:MAG: hypothetical protein QOI95_2078 [Acidimicrobiaceae bacterium]|jgi:divalent metal cation (Fe/Co/Zn/Cd) transporter
MRGLLGSMAVLAVAATAELGVALLSHSVAVLADMTHNFAGALTAIPLGLAFVFARRTHTPRYTYELGRVEDLAGLFVALVPRQATFALSSNVGDARVYRRAIAHWRARRMERSSA